MAINKTTTNLEEIKAEVIANHEKAMASTTIQEREQFERDRDEGIGYYNTQSKCQRYAQIRATTHPMRVAVDATYPTLRVKTTQDKETKTIIEEIADSSKPIDLLDLDKRLGGIGGDPHWKYMIQKLNRYMTVDSAKDLNDKNIDLDNFYMKEAAEKISLGKTPLSNTQFLKTVQSIVTAMLGEDYKEDPNYPNAFNCTSHDVQYLKRTYERKGKAKTVKTATHKALTDIFKDICSRVLNGDYGYTVVQKECNRKKK